MEVATARSMSLAAAKLGMTQSAVSQAMRKLEADLGVTLVVRGRRPVTLTAAGVTLEQRAEPLLREAAGLAQALRNVGNVPAQLVRLGLVDTFASTAGPGLVRELTASATRVVIWSGLAPSLGAALLDRDVDAIVTPDPLDDIDGLRRFPLWKEPFLLLLPQALRAEAATLTLNSLAAALPLVRYSARSHTGLQVERHIRRVGVVAERRLEVDGSDTLVAMVAAGVGWAISTPLCLLQGAGHAARVPDRALTMLRVEDAAHMGVAAPLVLRGPARGQAHRAAVEVDTRGVDGGLRARGQWRCAEQDRDDERRDDSHD